MRIHPNKLVQRKRQIAEGIEASGKWDKTVIAKYIDRSKRDLSDEQYTQELDDDFRADLLKVRKAKILMGALRARRELI